MTDLHRPLIASPPTDSSLSPLPPGAVDTSGGRSRSASVPLVDPNLAANVAGLGLVPPTRTGGSPTLSQSSLLSSPTTEPKQPKSPWKTWARPVGVFSRAVHGLLNLGYRAGRWGLEEAGKSYKAMKEEYEHENVGKMVGNALVAAVVGAVSGAVTLAFGLFKAPYYWWNLGIEALDKFLDKKIHDGRASRGSRTTWKLLANLVIRPILFLLDFLFVATMIALTPIVGVAQIGATVVGGLLGLFGANAPAIVSGLVAAAKGIASMIAAIFTTASPAATATVTIACSIPAAPAIDRVANVAKAQGERIENDIELATTPAVLMKSPSDSTSSTPPPLDPNDLKGASLRDAAARTKDTTTPAIGQSQQQHVQLPSNTPATLDSTGYFPV